MNDRQESETREARDGPPDDKAFTLTRAQARAVDGYAIERAGVPGLVLMENAAINVAGVVMDVLREHYVVDADSARVAVVCGGGNNGGDGYAVARQLASFGLSPTVTAVSDPARLTGDAAAMHRAWLGVGGGVTPALETAAVEAAACGWAEAHVVVDAVLGTGYGEERGAMRPTAAAAVAAINQKTTGHVVAVDVPSGLDADTGRPAAGSDAVRADVTVSFLAEKAGFAVPGAGGYLGRVVLADIGLPEAVWRAAAGGVE
ncbi:MAG: NAD(P)H-hydrate epimerase [Planctomycetota bacterium]